MPTVRSQARSRPTEKAGSYPVPGLSLNLSGGCDVPRGNEAPGGVGCSAARQWLQEGVLMAVLVGHRGISGAGVYWQITQPDDPDVLTMVFPEQVATDAAVPDVSLPEVVGQEAWTLDFDAVRAHLESQSSSHFPAWARGQVGATPTEVGPSVRFDITPEMIG